MAEEIAVDDVVQIDPEHDEAFGGCLMIVTELKPSWDGLVGFVDVPGKGDAGGRAYYRCPADAVVRVGPATWYPEPMEMP